MLRVCNPETFQHIVCNNYFAAQTINRTCVLRVRYFDGRHSINNVFIYRCYD